MRGGKVLKGGMKREKTDLMDFTREEVGPSFRNFSTIWWVLLKRNICLQFFWIILALF